MKLDNTGIKAIEKHEGVRYVAYQDSVGVWTIGRGMTYYPSWFKNGRKVRRGDEITTDEEKKLFLSVLEQFEVGVSALVKNELTQNQYNALVSFTYNVGLGNLRKSTLLKKVNTNPNDVSIKTEFMKWNKAGGKVLDGLTNRRRAEAKLYFTN